MKYLLRCIAEHELRELNERGSPQVESARPRQRQSARKAHQCCDKREDVPVSPSEQRGRPAALGVAHEVVLPARRAHPVARSHARGGDVRLLRHLRRTPSQPVAGARRMPTPRTNIPHASRQTIHARPPPLTPTRLTRVRHLASVAVHFVGVVAVVVETPF